VLNPILILFLPWAFKGKWGEEKKLLFGYAIFFLLYSFVLVDLRIRYILPIVPPLVILLVYALHNLYLRVSRPVFLYLGVAFLLSLNGVYLWSYFREVSPLLYLSGKESRDAYLSRMLPDYPAFQYVNQNLPPTAKVYLLFMGRRAYYCDRDYFHDPGEGAWTLIHMVRGSRNGNDVRAKLEERGLTHLVVRERLLGPFLSNNLTSEEWTRWQTFAQSYLQGLFHSRGYSVYRIT
jgi:hypothetical protein